MNKANLTKSEIQVALKSFDKISIEKNNINEFVKEVSIKLIIINEVHEKV